MREEDQSTPQETPAFEDNLRSDLIPASQAIPDRSLFRERLIIFTPARLISIVLVIFLSVIGWILFAGPGKPFMEKTLDQLAKRVAFLTSTPKSTVKTPTLTTVGASPTPGVVTTLQPSQTQKPVSPAETPKPSPTPTEPDAVIIEISPTPTFPPTDTPTSPPPPTATATLLPTAAITGCIQASLITPADVGKTLCVTGNVLRTEVKPNSFLIILENPKDAFYFLSYDRKWENLKGGECVFATGKILQLGNNPVMVLDYKIPLEYCP